ncbi:hypothetical protein DealDRAFT_2451 [Dethiobacter alkaliphilus AHT 1]|uniref:Uncharacterized protein n=1 Tax=Dethiobacter alkaliphilus AHT 1 TaxID=555088 RepID=C0GIZ2_DETAL|nr:hypothetical protein DealDRAFT_2451 [Dethiobacter alkaliphilus AHT 1]
MAQIVNVIREAVTAVAAFFSYLHKFFTDGYFSNVCYNNMRLQGLSLSFEVRT